MRFRSFIIVALAMLGLLQVTALQAQSTVQQWDGYDITQVTRATNNGSAGSVTGGQWFLLYNVGTGRFLINGGDWGTEGRLLYDDWGKLLKYTNDNLIYTGVETATNAWFWGANVPEVTSSFTWTNGDETFYTLLDTRKNYSTSGTRTIEFTRVATTGSDYTYYVHEQLGGKTYYLGAAYGEFYDTRDESRETGTFVHIDDDRAVWTSDDVTAKTDKVTIFENQEVEAKKLYQWRVVTLKQFEDQVVNTDASAYGGLDVNISYRITDQDFSRNVAAFFNSETDEDAEEQGWNVTSNATGGNGRYRYTWGWVNNPVGYRYTEGGTTNPYNPYCNNQYNGSSSYRYVDEPWDTPVRLKEQFVWNYALNAQGRITGNWQKKDCKYGYLSFEGTGTVSTIVTAPATGYYRVQCYGFSQSTNDSDDHNGYLFAQTETETSGEGYAQTYLYKMPAGTYERTTYNQAIEAGKLLIQGPEYLQSFVTVYAEKGQKIRIGVGKAASTRSSSQSYGNNRYYYDTDWVAVDNFQIIYMGGKPVIFDEEKTSLDYLKQDGNDFNYENRPVYLKREFMQNQWNSFVFPLSLTKAQVRSAFGADAKLAKLHGLGTLSGIKTVIDFQTINLQGDGDAIDAGEFYIITPTKAPTMNAETSEAYYTIGRRTFNTASLPATHSNTVSDKDNSVFITSYATYVNGGTAPKGSYVLGRKASEDKIFMYYLSKETPIKGFRGWLVDGNGSLPSAQNIDIYLNGISGEVNGIENILNGATTVYNKANGIYDMSGRKVSDGSLVNSQLPKGIYIVNGKKYVVK